MLTIERLCQRIIRLIYAPIRIYDGAGHLVRVFEDKGEQQDPLVCDDALRDRLMMLGSEHGPRLHIEADEIIYGIICHDNNTYILGPCFLGRDAVTAARSLVRRHHMDIKFPYRLTKVTMEYFCEILILLYEQLTDRSLNVHELYLQCFGGKELERVMQGKMLDVFYDLRETNIVHNPYSQELREQESIRTGDLEGLYRAFQESYTGRIGTVSRDPLRQAKNIAIVLITLASRSAMQGGLLPEVAYTMSDAFIQQVEDLASIGQVEALSRQAEIEYCAAVARRAENGSNNPLIMRCKELVVENLHERLSVKDLAANLEITSDYLSRLFFQEEGIRLTEYILQQKIADAKTQLVYTDRTYDSIAHALSFASQSHFGQVFKKFTGMTPKRYRETHAKATDKDTSNINKS